MENSHLLVAFMSSLETSGKNDMLHVFVGIA
jgi:hypothetical protein